MHATPHSRFRAPGFVVALAAIGVIALAAGVVHFAPSSCAAPVAAAGTGTAVYYNPMLAQDRCSIEPLARDGLYASLPRGMYRGGADCGAYLSVTGPRGTVQAEVVDMCPGCEADQLDLSSAAFARVQPLADGTAPVSYRLARDPALPGPLAVRIQPGSTRGSLALQVLNHGNPLTRVRLDNQNLTPRADGYWVARTTAGGGPFLVTVTDNAGDTAVLPGIAFRPGAVQRTSVLMYRQAVPAPSSAPRPAAGSATGPGTGPASGSQRAQQPPARPHASATC